MTHFQTQADILTTLSTAAHVIRIEPEVLEPLAETVFLRAARSFNLPDPNRVPGYTIAVDGEVVAVRDTIEAATAYAMWLRRDEPEIPVLIGG